MDENGPSYVVVVNDEKQYSIWPAGSSLPAGWQAAGFEGTKTEAMAWIEAQWDDQRPAALRGHPDNTDD